MKPFVICRGKNYATYLFMFLIRRLMNTACFKKLGFLNCNIPVSTWRNSQDALGAGNMSWVWLLAPWGLTCQRGRDQPIREQVLFMLTNERSEFSPVSEGRDHQTIGVAQILEPVVERRVDHLELDCLLHPVVSVMRRKVSRWRNFYFWRGQQNSWPHLAGPRELGDTRDFVLD